MSQQIIMAGEGMYRVLQNLPFICTFEHPYAPRGEQRTQCGRCRAMAAWKLATGDKPAVNVSTARVVQPA